MHNKFTCSQKEENRERGKQTGEETNNPDFDRADEERAENHGLNDLNGQMWTY